MKDSVGESTRIKLKFLFSVLEVGICLQRKKWYGWKTTQWILPSLVEGFTCSEIKEWLLWAESYKKKTERSIGKEIMNRCTCDFKEI